MSDLIAQAAEGFDGSIPELAKASGIPVRTLYNLRAGTGGSTALRVLLAILAANPRYARGLCKRAQEQLEESTR